MVGIQLKSLQMNKLKINIKDKDQNGLKMINIGMLMKIL